MARRHHPLIEGAGRAIAVVAAIAHLDGALLVHRVIGAVLLGTGTHPGIEGLQTAVLRVAAFQLPEIAAAAAEHAGHETPVDGGVGFVDAGVVAGEEPRLHVRHDPGAGARPAAPAGGGAEIDALHRAGAHRQSVGRGIAVIEAAAVGIMLAVHHRMDAGGLVVDRQVARIVVAETHARHDVDAIGLVAAADGDGRHVGDGLGVEGALVRAGIERARRRLHQIIALARLVVDAVDVTQRARAETILRRRIGEAAGDDADIQQPSVGALHLIERAAIARRQGSHRRVRGDARGSRRRIDVARALWPRLLRRDQCGERRATPARASVNSV